MCKKTCCISYWDRHNQDRYRYGMLFLTFLCYMSYHISRKPFSIVKGELHMNCSLLLESSSPYSQHSLHNSFAFNGTSIGLPLLTKANGTWCDFAPFDKANYKSMFGELDYAFLLAYAIGMFFSGIIAERMPLRYFLSAGMILSGVFTAMFGFGYYQRIHVLSYYVVVQVLNGLLQTTGWPAVVTCMGNWFGKKKRGLIMGIWNSHTSVGNILGSLIASAFVATAWGLSFIIPGVIIASLGVVSFFTLIEKPEDLTASYHLIPNDSDNEHSAYHRLVGNSTEQSNSPDNASDEETVGNNSEISHSNNKPIGFCDALWIPGVVEFALCLLFAKLVSYTFLFWLPFYIQNTSTLNTQSSGVMSTLFDIGGITGGIAAGVLSDRTGGRATTCGVMLCVGAIMMYMFNLYASTSMTWNIVLLLTTGAFVNGPYALITTAVSADLGTHPVLKGNAKALSTVTAIIDGTGSIGAAIGPYFTGLILRSRSDIEVVWKMVFAMLIGANVAAFVLLLRLITKEVCGWCETLRRPTRKKMKNAVSRYDATTI